MILLLSCNIGKSVRTFLCYSFGACFHTTFIFTGPEITHFDDLSAPGLVDITVPVNQTLVQEDGLDPVPSTTPASKPDIFQNFQNQNYDAVKALLNEKQSDSNNDSGISQFYQVTIFPGDI